MAAFPFLDLRGKQCNSEGVLVIIRNDSAFDGVADGLPTLVVLVENMAAFYGRMLINDQQGPAVKGQLLSARHISVQQAADGIGKPVRILITAMGQQRIEGNMKPAIT